MSWQCVLTECSERLDSNAACLGANVAGRICQDGMKACTVCAMMRVLRVNKGRASVPGVSEELYAEDEAPHGIQKDERRLSGP